MSASESVLVEVRNLKKHFADRRGFFGSKNAVRAVDGVSFSVAERECFGIVGESGCGKSTLGRLILALETPSEGEVSFEGENVFALSRARLRTLRLRMQPIFQDPFSSLNPRMTVREIIEEPFLIHKICADPPEREKKVLKLLDVVGLAQAHLERHPHEFSGGQRQRIGIARALALNPKLLVADEPVSSLDVSIQAQILNLLKDLQQEFRLTYIFITHDFSVVRHLCDRVAVMYLGKIAEIAQGDALFHDPQHPYTEALLSAVPVPDPAIERKRHRVLLKGDMPSPFDPPSGCAFHPRCPYAQPSCSAQAPHLIEARPGHRVACPVLPFKDRPSEAAIKNL